MKNISISNDVWRELRKIRDNIGVTHYSAVIQYLIKNQKEQKNHQAVPEERLDGKEVGNEKQENHGVHQAVPEERLDDKKQNDKNNDMWDI